MLVELLLIGVALALAAGWMRERKRSQNLERIASRCLNGRRAARLLAGLTYWRECNEDKKRIIRELIEVIAHETGWNDTEIAVERQYAGERLYARYLEDRELTAADTVTADPLEERP